MPTVSRATFRDHLGNSLADVPGISERQFGQLCQHHEAMELWSKRINLTRITNLRDAAWFHYRDSLEALRFLPSAGTVMDIGSGAGFPGIPLAVMRPECQFVLLDSLRKRCSFLQVVASRLSLSNVRILNGRQDEAAVNADVAVTRATFSSPEDIQSCLTCLREHGKLVCFTTESKTTSGTRHLYSILGRRLALDVFERT